MKRRKWSKKVRKELERLGVAPMELNRIEAVSSENPEKYIMPVKKVSKKEARRIYPKRREGTLKLNKDNLAEFEKGTLTPKRPKRLKGICLNWPGEVKK